MRACNLILLRHAKSAYPESVADHDRPLNERGERDAVAAGVWLLERRAQLLGADPLILVSSALRAQQTWARVSSALALPAREEPRLYAAAVSTLIDVIAPGIAQGRTTLVIAHNPGLEDLAGYLTSGEDSPARERMLHKYPTSGIAVLRMRDDRWADGSAELVEFAVPRA